MDEPDRAPDPSRSPDSSPSPAWGEQGWGWELLVLVGIALVGGAIAVYLTLTHFSSLPLVCTVGGPVNCVAVTHSAYSVIPGTTVPISILGVLWFAVSAGLALSPARMIHFAWAALGLLVVLYLVFVEIVLLHQICEWCTAVHLLVLATFVLALLRLQRSSAAGYEAA